MTEAGSAYDAAATAWRAGPERVYARLAAALLDHAPVALAGARVLDVGAGSCVAALEARRRGARLVVGTDLAPAMLAPELPVVVADAGRLPFADGAFDLVVQGFLLSHLPDPPAALGEARRVAPALAASAFDPAWEHPAKRVVDEVMTEAGFTVPAWYAAIKRQEPSGPDELAGWARAAGYGDVRVAHAEVDAGLEGPADVVRWRWGMAHLAPYVATLEPARREELRARAEEAVAGLPPVRVHLLALSAR